MAEPAAPMRQFAQLFAQSTVRSAAMTLLARRSLTSSWA
jgi:hypothetical protein